jgi:hypothetical protein
VYFFCIGINPIIYISSFLTTSFEFYEHSVMDWMWSKMPNNTCFTQYNLNENIKNESIKSWYYMIFWVRSCHVRMKMLSLIGLCLGCPSLYFLDEKFSFSYSIFTIDYWLVDFFIHFHLIWIKFIV